MHAQDALADIIVADDGTVTLPANVARRAGWTAGMKLILATSDAHVSLTTPLPPRVTRTAEEVFAELAAIRPGGGRVMTIEEMDQAVREAAVARYQRSL